MKIQVTVLLFLAFVLSLASDIESDQARKHYGMSYHVKCDNYVKSFTCMSACKSIGFQVFRMDHRCKCSCHELKTTTILPFFKWLTNGSTQQWHKTQSVPLYHVVGTLSPPTYMDYSEHDTADTAMTIAGSDQTQDTGNTTGAGGGDGITGTGQTAAGGAATTGKSGTGGETTSSNGNNAPTTVATQGS